MAGSSADTACTPALLDAIAKPHDERIDEDAVVIVICPQENNPCHVASPLGSPHVLDGTTRSRAGPCGQISKPGKLRRRSPLARLRRPLPKATIPSLRSALARS